MTNEPSESPFLMDSVRRTVLPVDDGAHQRAGRLRELGLGQAQESEFDDFARHVAMTAQDLAGLDTPPVTFVNFVGHDQFVAGVYMPPAVADAVGGLLRNRIPLDAGYCPYVVARQKALILDDVLDYPRFAGNPIVDRLMVRSYAGAPLKDRTGTVLGTICVVDSEPRPWGNAGLDLMKQKAADLVHQIHRREGQSS